MNSMSDPLRPYRTSSNAVLPPIISQVQRQAPLPSFTHPINQYIPSRGRPFTRTPDYGLRPPPSPADAPRLPQHPLRTPLQRRNLLPPLYSPHHEEIHRHNPCDRSPSRPTQALPPRTIRALRKLAANTASPTQTRQCPRLANAAGCLLRFAERTVRSSGLPQSPVTAYAARGGDFAGIQVPGETAPWGMFASVDTEAVFVGDEDLGDCLWDGT